MRFRSWVVVCRYPHKKKFDFATYREEKLGFYVASDSEISDIKEPKDVAGLRIIVGSGTNQEKIPLAWDKKNRSTNRHRLISSTTMTKRCARSL